MIVKRMSMTAVVLFFFTLVGGCEPRWTTPKTVGTLEQPTEATVCLDLPFEQVPSARLAVEGWDRALGQWRRITARVGAPWNSTCTYWVHETTNVNIDDDHAIAWASMLGGHEISMRKGWYEHDTTGILLHELGHAFGAQHVPGTLMNATYWRHGFTCPDATTVAQVAAFNHVNLALLCWCYD